MTRPLVRFALVGHEGQARAYVAAIRESRLGTLGGVVDPIAVTHARQLVRQYAPELGERHCYETLDDLFAAGVADVVIVCHDQRFTDATAAVQAGLSALASPSLCGSLEEARNLVEARPTATGSGPRPVAGYGFPYQPVVAALAARLDRIGPLTGAKVSWLVSDVRRAGGDAGGAILALGAPLLAPAWTVLGAPAVVSVEEARAAINEDRVELACSGRFLLAGDLTLEFELGHSQGGDTGRPTLTFWGERGTLVVNLPVASDMPGRGRLYGVGSETAGRPVLERFVTSSPPDMNASIVDRFAQAHLGEPDATPPPYLDAAEGAGVAELVNLARAAVRGV